MAGAAACSFPRAALLLLLLECASPRPALTFHLLDTVTPGGHPSKGGCGIERTPGCYENRLRIAVLSFATRAAHPASLANSFITSMYTLKHGYDLITERCAQSTVSNGSYTWCARSTIPARPAAHPGLAGTTAWVRRASRRPSTGASTCSS